MFFGHYRHTLDPKGRLSIPTKFREILSNGSDGILMVTADFNECLAAYPLEHWSRILEKVRALPMTDKNVKDFMRGFISRAMECPLDKQGRILIPPGLREFPKIGREVVLLGMDYKFEIWDYGRWKEKMQKIYESGEDISAALASLGL